MRKQTKYLYYEKTRLGFKTEFTFEEALKIAEGCEKTKKVIGVGYIPENLVVIDKYNGKFGKGFILHMNTFWSDKKQKHYHEMYYYLENKKGGLNNELH